MVVSCLTFFPLFAVGLGRAGACVYVTGRNEETIKAAAEEVTAAGGKGHHVSEVPRSNHHLDYGMLRQAMHSRP